MWWHGRAVTYEFSVITFVIVTWSSCVGVKYTTDTVLVQMSGDQFAKDYSTVVFTHYKPHEVRPRKSKRVSLGSSVLQYGIYGMVVWYVLVSFNDRENY